MHNNSTAQFSWANKLATDQNNKLHDNNNWPKLKNEKNHEFHHQTKTTEPQSSNFSNTTVSTTVERINAADSISNQINSITKDVKNVQLSVDPKPPVVIEHINNNRSREDILKDRSERKRQQRAEKQLVKYQIQLKNIREPKTDKLKIITPTIATIEVNQSLMQSTSAATPITKHNDITKPSINKYKHFKKSNVIKISISDSIINSQNKKLYQLNFKEQKHNFINTTATTNITASSTVPPTFTTTKKVTTVDSKLKLNKGKHREIPKKKWISHLKRAILLKRLQSKNQRQFLMVSRKQENDSIAIKDDHLSSSIITTIDTNASSANTSNSEKEQKNPPVIEKETIRKNISENDCTVQTKTSIQHSRKFRTYCNNFLIKEICECTEMILKDLFRFQLRAYNNNNVKGRAKRRYVVGFKETERQLDAGKLRLLIIAPDLEKCAEPGGIDELIERFKVKCDKFNVPYVFSINRHKIGYILLKKVPISCVGIMSYDGTEDNVKNLLKLIEDERKRYLEMIK